MDEIPHAFRDPRLLELALTHASADGGANNERLEFLGDAALDLIVADELFHHHADLPEGTLTELKASVVSRRSLARAARGLDLGTAVTVGRGMEGRQLSAAVMAGLYEALLGAVYLDAGFERAREFALATLQGALERARRREPLANPKQRFQELCQARWGVVPDYELLAERGQAHARAFQVEARVGDERYPSAWGRTRKEAESWAAHEALLVLDARAGGEAG